MANYKRHIKYILPFFILLIYIPVPLAWKPKSMTESLTAYMILVMATLWMTKCIPVEATALFPVIMAPVLGITGSHRIVAAYLNDSVLFFMGCSVFACAIEHSDLHSRIILKILVNQKPCLSNLLFGMMLATTFLSMFISNSSCAAMVFPIIVSILGELDLGGRGNISINQKWESSPSSFVTLYSRRSKMLETDSSVLPDKRSEMEMLSIFPKEKIKTLSFHPSVMSGDLNSLASTKTRMDAGVNTSSFGNPTSVSNKPTPKLWIREGFRSDSQFDSYFDAQCNHAANYKMRSMFLLAAAFSVNIGGTAMLTGCAANIVTLYSVNIVRHDIETNLSKVLDGKECVKSLNLNAFTWFEFNMIATWLNFICGFVFFRTYFLKNPCSSLSDYYDYFESTRLVSLKKLLKTEYQSQGPMTFHQYAVAILFCTWIVCLLSENMNGVRGWGLWLELDSLGGSTITVLIVILMFFIPRQTDYFKQTNQRQRTTNKNTEETLITWEFVQAKLPWKNVLLLGGGNAILICSKTSGLWDTVSATFVKHGFASMPHLATLCLVFAVALLWTSVVSSTTAAILIVPIALKLAISAGAHPLYFVLHVATICSYSFLLTTGTAINTTFTKVGNIKQKDILKCGLCLLIICIFVLLCITHTFSESMLHFSSYKSFCDPV